MMIAGLLFFAVGCGCGFSLTFFGFALVLVVGVPVYAIAILALGITGAGFAFAILVALVAMQVGYFSAILCRIAFRRLRGRSRNAKESPTPSPPRDGSSFSARILGN
jgi:hypothetical protein